MANISSSNGLEKRPKLRFPGFDEPWCSHKFGSVFSFLLFHELSLMQPEMCWIFIMVMY